MLGGLRTNEQMVVGDVIVVVDSNLINKVELIGSTGSNRVDIV